MMLWAMQVADPILSQDRDVARLEAAVASRDRTISVLRQQLAGFARARTVAASLVAVAPAAEEAGDEGPPTVLQPMRGSDA